MQMMILLTLRILIGLLSTLRHGWVYCATLHIFFFHPEALPATHMWNFIQNDTRAECRGSECADKKKG